MLEARQQEISALRGKYDEASEINAKLRDELFDLRKRIKEAETLLNEQSSNKTMMGSPSVRNIMKSTRGFLPSNEDASDGLRRASSTRRRSRGASSKQQREASRDSDNPEYTGEQAQSGELALRLPSEGRTLRAKERGESTARPQSVRFAPAAEPWEPDYDAEDDGTNQTLPIYQATQRRKSRNFLPSWFSGRSIGQ